MKTLDDMIDELPADERAKVMARAQELMAGKRLLRAAAEALAIAKGETEPAHIYVPLRSSTSSDGDEG